MFCDSSGHVAGNGENLHLRPVTYQMDANQVFVKRIIRPGTVLGLCIKWMKIYFREENHAFWNSSGHTAGDAEILHSRPVMHRMGETHVFLKRLMHSGIVLCIRLGLLISCIQGWLCINQMEILFS